MESDRGKVPRFMLNREREENKFPVSQALSDNFLHFSFDPQHSKKLELVAPFQQIRKRRLWKVKKYPTKSQNK